MLNRVGDMENMSFYTCIYSVEKQNVTTRYKGRNRDRVRWG